MLEIRHLTKTYRPKRGVPVKALDDVSLTFGEKGMVFLLGKSGSGKSTLLNVLGGLDRFDSGEMILKGVSAHAFRQRELDSYRNTYLGFIFQEYNILEEFTVGANVALAIELQGRRATDEQINAILRQVDLSDCADRKPNELSGGQKQRVAIARALVKDPDVIMADEPTGALDSVTGRQVLDTLKRLSADKLVLVVSHDREFAERYADRIVELADGRVIRDVERAAQELPAQEGLAFDETGVTVPAGYRLTEEDREAINAYLAQREQGAVIQPRAGAAAAFVPTDPARQSEEKGEPFRLIRSKLPMKKAFAIGASALKYKKVRLVFTLILSVIAFTLFGLSDTMGAFDHQRACADSLRDSEIRYAAVRQSVEEGKRQQNMTAGEIVSLRGETGLNYCGSYDPVWIHKYDLREQYDADAFSIDEAVAEKTGIAYTLYAAEVNGFTELTEEDRAAYGFTMAAGRLPEKEGEIAVSRWLFETFRRGGYRAPDDDLGEDGRPLYRAVAAPEDLVGKTLRLGENGFTVVGVVDTGFDAGRYELLTRTEESMTTADMVLRFALENEYESEVHFGLASNIFVAEGAVAAMAANAPYYENNSWAVLRDEEYDLSVSGSLLCSLDQVDEGWIEWFGQPRAALGPGEVLVNIAQGKFYYEGDAARTTEEWAEIFDRAFTLSREDGDENGWKVVGIYHPVGAAEDSDMVMSDADLERLGVNEGRVYTFAVAPMPEGRGVDELVRFCYTDREGVSYPLQNPACYELDTLDEVFRTLSRIFLWMGVFFAGFAGLLLAAFIGASVSRKKPEIGILRAIGARGADVFRIFFSESFLIAAFNALMASITTGLATLAINLGLRERGLLVTVLHFGPRQILLLIVVSVGVAALASFFPVRRIAAKRPIDAINNR